MTLPIEHSLVRSQPVRSPAAIASGAIVLAAVPAAIVTSVTLGGGDGIVVHGFLAMGMAVLLRATSDFRVAPVVTIVDRVGMVVLGSIFALQGLADAFPWQPLSTVAYDMLGQWLEKAALYPVLIWFGGLLAFDSKGRSRVVGALVLSAVLAAELYSLWVVLTDGTPDAILRAMYLLPFVWLIIEGTKR